MRCKLVNSVSNTARHFILVRGAEVKRTDFTKKGVCARGCYVMLMKNFYNLRVIGLIAIDYSMLMRFTRDKQIFQFCVVFVLFANPGAHH